MMIHLNGNQIAERLMFAEKCVVPDETVYEQKILNSLPESNHEFVGHTADRLLYPDYATSQIINQGIRLLMKLLGPGLKGIPAGMVKHIKLCGQLCPGDHINLLIKKWQGRIRIAKFEMGIENQENKAVYESTVLGTVVDEI